MNYLEWFRNGEKSTHDLRDEDIATHMKRYHPHGFNPKTITAYLLTIRRKRMLTK